MLSRKMTSLVLTQKISTGAYFCGCGWWGNTFKKDPDVTLSFFGGRALFWRESQKTRMESQISPFFGGTS
jgi:hypothetical protein